MSSGTPNAPSGCDWLDRATISVADANRAIRAAVQAEREAVAQKLGAFDDMLAALKALQPILWNDGPLPAAYRDVEPLVEAAIARAEGR